MTALNDRAQHLLNMLIEHYIRDGQPVGSKKLAEDHALALSSASIRHVLSDLEHRGYLSSPHTSAGRIPTIQGYRLFVDNLLSVRAVQPDMIDTERLVERFSNGYFSSPVQSASSLLSALTNYAGLVTLPRRKQSLLSKVEFLPLSDNRVLVILIFEDDEVQNQIIYTDKPYSPDALQQAANFINQHYAHQSLEATRQAISTEMTKQQETITRGMELLIKATQAKEEMDSTRDYILEGQNHLFHASEELDVDRLRELFEAFTEKQKVLHLLDKSIDSSGVKIFIGHESGYAAFEHCSLVTSTYQVDDETVGVLGVIGPTRMNYRQVISVVDITAKLLGKALSERLDD